MSTITLVDEQIERLGHKNYKQWFEKAMKDAPAGDCKAAGPWLEARHSGLIKSLSDIDTAIHNYLQVSKERRLASDPDVIKLASKVDQALAVGVTLLQDLEKTIKFTKLGSVIVGEARLIDGMRKGIHEFTAAGETVHCDGVGNVSQARKPAVDADVVRQVQVVLKKFEQIQAAARDAKATYKKCKLDAKAAFAEYEGYVRMHREEYQPMKIDWDAPDAWEAVGNDEMLINYMMKYVGGA
jgi:hypothetical protein